MLITIVIPVYNAEPYLEKCLSSVLGQIYKNIEVILIDDCSTDNSFAIVRDFEKHDNRIRVFQNEKNSLVGFSRNLGIREAKGEYIWFVDADDWIELDACNCIVTALKENGNADLMLFGYERHLPENKTKKKIPSSQINSENAFQYYLQLRRGFCPMCFAYVYSREFLLDNKIFFKENVFYEDVAFSAKANYHQRSILVMSTVFYHYNRENQGSITSTKSKKKIKDLISAHDDIQNFMVNEGILQKNQNLLLSRFLVFGLPPCIQMYLRLPKEKRKDGYFERELLSYKKSKILSKSTLFGVLAMTRSFGEDEKPLKRIYGQNIWFLWLFQNAFQIVKILNLLSLKGSRLRMTV